MPRATRQIGTRLDGAARVAECAGMHARQMSAETSHRTNDFACALYCAAASAPDASGNLATSPVSLAIGLAMAWAGARSETAAEIGAVLRLPGDRASSLAQLAGLVDLLASPGPGVTLLAASRAFVNRAFPLDPSYAAEVVQTFGSDVAQLSFEDLDAATRAINAWAAEVTQRELPSVLPPNALAPRTPAVLVNAIYFKASWEYRFEETRDAAFFVAPDRPIAVPTMFLEAHLHHAATDGVQILELPYVGEEVAMWIVLPAPGRALAEVEAALDAAAVARWRAALTWGPVRVELPRFEVNPAQPLALRPILAALGMPRAFSDELADFTGLTQRPIDRGEIYVQDVFHKARVRVDEQGTVAAADTAVLFRERGAPKPPTEFVANRPFLFAIVHRASGLFLFLGRVADPSQGA